MLRALLGFGFCVCALRRGKTAAGNTSMTHFPVRRQQDTLKLEDGYKSSCIAGEDGGKGKRDRFVAGKHLFTFRFDFVRKLCQLMKPRGR